MEDKNKIDTESAEQENLNRTAMTITDATVVSDDQTAGNDSSAGMTMATVGEPTQPTSQPTQPTSQPTQPTKPEDSQEQKSKTLNSDAYIFPFLLCFSLLFFSQLTVRPPQTALLLFGISFPWGWSRSLSPVQCHKPPPIVHQALYLSDLVP